MEPELSASLNQACKETLTLTLGQLLIFNRGSKMLGIKKSSGFLNSPSLFHHMLNLRVAKGISQFDSETI